MSERDWKVLVSPGCPVRRPDREMYSRALARLMEQNNDFLTFSGLSEWHEKSPETYSQFLFLCIRIVGRERRRDGVIIPEMVKRRWELLHSLLEMLSVYSPRELLQQYPVTKRYDGARWEEKDYFFVMQKMQALDQGRPIMEQADMFELLMDYQNTDLELFAVGLMRSLSDMRRLDGHPGVLEEFMAERGVVPVQYHEKEGYIYDPSTGRSYPIKKPRPRVPKWLRVVKGGSGSD